jgi:hypothetical protein
VVEPAALLPADAVPAALLPADAVPAALLLADAVLAALLLVDEALPVAFQHLPDGLRGQPGGSHLMPYGLHEWDGLHLQLDLRVSPDAMQLLSRGSLHGLQQLPDGCHVLPDYFLLRQWRGPGPRFLPRGPVY